jgi:hypothetical protein
VGNFFIQQQVKAGGKGVFKFALRKLLLTLALGEVNPFG